MPIKSAAIAQINDLIAARRAAKKRKVALQIKATPKPTAYSVAAAADLFTRLTTLQPVRRRYYGKPEGDLFIHWYYRDRKEDRLSKCEIFHLNMLRYFNVMDRVEEIHVRCAARGTMTNAMRQALEILDSGKARVAFRIVEPKDSWEHDTFRDAVEHAVSNGRRVYYTHFKGVTHVVDNVVKGPYRNGAPHGAITPLNVLYWCYIMYRYMFADAPSSAVAVGPLYYPKRQTMHYCKGGLTPTWALDRKGHYTGSFQAFDGAFLRERFASLGADRRRRGMDLWIGDPYTVEQFLALVYQRDEVASLTETTGSYQLYDRGVIPQYKRDFDAMYVGSGRAACIAQNTYKWIGGTDTFNWALGRALLDLGFKVYYYAPTMDGSGVTEKYMLEEGMQQWHGEHLDVCFANQLAGRYFVDRCPVIQTCHSAYTRLENPIKGCKAYVAVTEEIQKHCFILGYSMPVIMNGLDLDRYAPRIPLRDVPSVLSICQGDDSMLAEACHILGYQFASVPKDRDSRIWHIEDLINQADIVVGIGRSLYDGMACGRAVISWDNRPLNPCCGCGYVTKGNWESFAKTNLTGRGFPKIDTVDKLVAELRKYNPADGAAMRAIAEEQMDVRKNILQYLRMVGEHV